MTEGVPQVRSSALEAEARMWTAQERWSVLARLQAAWEHALAVKGLVNIPVRHHVVMMDLRDIQSMAETMSRRVDRLRRRVQAIEPEVGRT